MSGHQTPYRNRCYLILPANAVALHAAGAFHRHLAVSATWPASRHLEGVRLQGLAKVMDAIVYVVGPTPAEMGVRQSWFRGNPGHVDVCNRQRALGCGCAVTMWELEHDYPPNGQLIACCFAF
jgi:hypothetical protein